MDEVSSCSEFCGEEDECRLMRGTTTNLKEDEDGGALAEGGDRLDGGQNRLLASTDNNSGTQKLISFL